MKVLVHTDPHGEQAYGIWWVDSGGALQNLYITSGSPQEARGRVIMYSKTNEAIGWHRWFDELTTRQPFFENWAVYDSMGMTPEQMLGGLNPLPATA